MRNNKIDIIRAGGTILVILAHVFPPDLIQNIRSFDVIALVFISGLSFKSNEQIKYFKYISHRIKKLVIPTYLVITSIFLFTFIASLIFSINNPFTTEDIIKSYFFIEGIGYIWIVKIYLILALVSTTITSINKKIRNDYLFVSYIVTIFFIFFSLSKSLVGLNSLILNEYIIISIPYVLIYWIGIRIRESGTTLKIMTLLSTVVVFSVVIYSINNSILLPMNDKYPPGFIYVTYGIFISLLLYILIPNKEIRIVKWISMNSFIIYLMHIYFVLGLNLLQDYVSFSFINFWLIKYLVILFGSFISTYFIKYVLNYYRKRVKNEIK
ncbi:acyltransferase family protein [Paracholeplasma manati]|uniref:acyltransferase family protein n=1 Tax=Paracholeplasma manati TaxID=591373 RepID=UPI00358FF441